MMHDRFTPRRGLLGLLLVLLSLSPLAAQTENSLEWRPGTLIQSEYKEMAGTVFLGASSPPVLRSEGREYLLILLVQESEIPNFKNKTPAILKGIAGTVALPGQPTQYLFWPMSCTIRSRTFTFPDPTALHREWLTNLGRE